MSILTTLTRVLTKASGLSVRTKVEIWLVAALCLALWLGWQWVHDLQTTNQDQARKISTLNANKATLEQQKLQLQTDKAAAEAQRDVYAQRTEALNQENKENELKAQMYQTDSENARKQLAELQHDDACAAHPVPDAVISVQQQAISKFNAGYSDKGDGSASAG